MLDEFQVNDCTTGTQRPPTLALTASGAVHVVWEGAGPGDGKGILAVPDLADRLVFATGFESGDVAGWSLAGPP